MQAPQQTGTVATAKVDEPHPRTKGALRLVFFILLMDVVGITIIAPVAPYIVGRYSNNALMVTMLTVIYAAAQFFAAPLLGRLSDRYGRKPVLLASVFGSAVGYIIFGVAGALWVLFLSRLIDGISGGNMSVASAYIADVSQPDKRAKNFALIGMAWSFGLILGPAAGAVFGQMSLEAPAFVAAGLSLMSVVLGFFFLPESLPKTQRSLNAIQFNELNPFVSIGAMARKAGLGSLLVVLCLFNFAFNGINNTEALFMIRKFGAEPWHIGLQLVLLGVTLAVVQATLVPRWITRYGEKSVLVTCLVGQAVGGIVTVLMPALWLIYPVTMLSRATSAFIFPALGALGTNHVSTQELGVFMGVTTALSSLMTVVGPLWAGFTFDHITPGAPYVLGAVIFVLAAFWMLRATDGQTT